MKVPNNIKKVDNDITDDEWDKLHVPCENNLTNFINKYIAVEVFVFSLTNAHFRGCLCEASLEQHYNSMLDIILIHPNLDDIKDEIIELINIKYNLTIVNENPLILEKWQ